MKRKIAAIGLTILVMLGVTGCMESYEEKNENMLAHMKEKYGVEFEIQHYIPRNVDCSYDVWYCNAVGDEETIEVHRYYGDMAKKREYADEYYVRITRDEVERRAVEAVSEITGEVKAYVSHLEFADEEYSELDQLDDFLQTEEGKIAFGIILYIVDKEAVGISNQKEIEELQKIIPNAGIGSPWIRIVYVKNEQLFAELNRENHSEMLHRTGKDAIYVSNYAGVVEKGFKEY